MITSSWLFNKLNFYIHVDDHNSKVNVNHVGYLCYCYNYERMYIGNV